MAKAHQVLEHQEHWAAEDAIDGVMFKVIRHDRRLVTMLELIQRYHLLSPDSSSIRFHLRKPFHLNDILTGYESQALPSARFMKLESSTESYVYIMSLEHEAVTHETAGNSVSMSICVMSSDDFFDLKLSGRTM